MDQRMLIPTETLVDDRRDVTATSEIRLSPGSSGFQVDGPGMVDTVMVRSDSQDYRVRVETGRTLVVDDDWATLETIAQDLSHISAYDDSGNYVVVVEDYPYRKYSTVTVDPKASVTFSRIRGEWILGVPVSF